MALPGTELFNSLYDNRKIELNLGELDKSGIAELTFRDRRG